jgi:hypothetical protein
MVDGLSLVMVAGRNHRSSLSSPGTVEAGTKAGPSSFEVEVISRNMGISSRDTKDCSC